MSVRDRALSVIELLAHTRRELQLIEIADGLDIPRAATHRVLADLKDGGYVRQDREGGPYKLTAKIASLGFAYLASSGITDTAQPTLTRLAEATGELARLAVIDGSELTWVAKAQGKPFGLVIDPDQGAEVFLAAAANGHAWLACLSDEEALELVARQGFRRDGYGPGAPQTIADLMTCVTLARANGFATVTDAWEMGTSAIATAIIRHGMPIGTVSVAGPTVRMTADRMKEIAPTLIAAARELATLAAGSPLFERARPQVIAAE